MAPYHLLSSALHRVHSTCAPPGRSWTLEEGAGSPGRHRTRNDLIPFGFLGYNWQKFGAELMALVGGLSHQLQCIEPLPEALSLFGNRVEHSHISAGAPEGVRKVEGRLVARGEMEGQAQRPAGLREAVLGKRFVGARGFLLTHGGGEAALDFPRDWEPREDSKAATGARSLCAADHHPPSPGEQEGLRRIREVWPAQRRSRPGVSNFPLVGDEVFSRVSSKRRGRTKERKLETAGFPQGRRPSENARIF